jgi:hypothetical protein
VADLNRRTGSSARRPANGDRPVPVAASHRAIRSHALLVKGSESERTEEDTMPRISKAEAALVVDEPVIEGRYAELSSYTIGFETHKADVDPAPLFAGLPGDRCQSPHWGLVVTGKVVFRYPDHDEVFQAGDAYYAPPGHLPLMFAGTDLVEFSPTEALEQTMAVVGRNLEAAKSEATRSTAQ